MAKKYVVIVRNAQNKIIEQAEYNTPKAAQIHAETTKTGGKGRAIKIFINGRPYRKNSAFD